MSRHDGKVWVRKLRTRYSTHPWEVRARNHNGYDYYETFYSWREALVEADRMARTREYVLPRPDEDSYIETIDEQIAWEGTAIEYNIKTGAWVEEPGTIGLAIGDCDHYMTTDGALSIALALAACVEQERVQREHG